MATWCLSSLMASMTMSSTQAFPTALRSISRMAWSLLFQERLTVLPARPTSLARADRSAAPGCKSSNGTKTTISRSTMVTHPILTHSLEERRTILPSRWHRSSRRRKRETCLTLAKSLLSEIPSSPRPSTCTPVPYPSTTGRASRRPDSARMISPLVSRQCKMLERPATE